MQYFKDLKKTLLVAGILLGFVNFLLAFGNMCYEFGNTEAYGDSHTNLILNSVFSFIIFVASVSIVHKDIRSCIPFIVLGCIVLGLNVLTFGIALIIWGIDGQIKELISSWYLWTILGISVLIFITYICAAAVQKKSEK